MTKKITTVRELRQWALPEIQKTLTVAFKVARGEDPLFTGDERATLQFAQILLPAMEMKDDHTTLMDSLRIPPNTDIREKLNRTFDAVLGGRLSPNEGHMAIEMLEAYLSIEEVEELRDYISGFRDNTTANVGRAH